MFRHKTLVPYATCCADASVSQISVLFHQAMQELMQVYGVCDGGFYWGEIFTGINWLTSKFSYSINLFSGKFCEIGKKIQIGFFHGVYGSGWWRSYWGRKGRNFLEDKFSWQFIFAMADYKNLTGTFFRKIWPNWKISRYDFFMDTLT